MRALASAVLGAVLALAPSAQALPGDPPITALDAVVADGVTVSYTCPVYRQADFGTGFVVFGGPSSYGAQLATSPERGSDGRLRADAVVALGEATEPNTLPEGQCATPFGVVKPGTYHWLAYRICTGCDGGYETSEVRELTVRARAALTLRPGWQPYAGHPAPYALGLAGVPDRAVVALQRRGGTGWRTLARAAALAEAGEAVATLPAGRHALRVRARLGDQTVTSAQRRVTVRRAGPERTVRPGRWTGSGGVAFRVADGGREVRGFEARVLMVCPDPTGLGQVTTRTGAAAFGRAGVDPQGRFLAAAQDGTSAVLVRGRLRGSKLTGGQAQLSAGTCSGAAAFTARRR